MNKEQLSAAINKALGIWIPQYVLKAKACRGYLKTFEMTIPIELVDVILFLKEIHPLNENVLRTELNNGPVKWSFVLIIDMIKETPDNVKHQDANFVSKATVVLNEHEIAGVLQSAYDKISESIEAYINKGSGWRINKIVKAEIHTAKYNPLKGSSYINLHRTKC